MSVIVALLGFGMTEPVPSTRPRRLGATYSVPTWLPPAAQEINEPSAVKVIGRLRRRPVVVDTDELSADILTSYWRTNEYAKESSPKVCFLHGADSNCFEWRYVAEKLGAKGADCIAVDWWTGGWTDREPIRRRLADADGTEPWTLVRQHLRAFLWQQYGDEPFVLVGASLGGAVAIDYATAHPDSVCGLVLVDAGGESYKAPPPDVVRALAPAVLAVKSLAARVQALLPSEGSRIGGLHRAEPSWSEAYGAYLASGGYVRHVGPGLIRQVTVPTLVVWGTDDAILPLSDAYAFERDLGASCAGVKEVAGAGHSPHLDDPETVATLLLSYIEGLGQWDSCTGADEGVS